MKIVTDKPTETPKLRQAFKNFLNSMRNPTNDRKGYGYTYTTLPSILSMIRKNASKQGLAFTQDVGVKSAGNGQVFTSCQSMLIGDDGTITSSTLYIPVVQNRNRSGAQAVGSAITYTKRYSAEAFCGIAGSDDDGSADTGYSNYRNSYNNYRSNYGNYRNNNYGNYGYGNNYRSNQSANRGNTQQSAQTTPATQSQKRRINNLLSTLFKAHNQTMSDASNWFKKYYHTDVANASMVVAKRALTAISQRVAKDPKVASNK